MSQQFDAISPFPILNPILESTNISAVNFTQNISKTDWYVIAGFWIMAFPVILMDYNSHMNITKACQLFIVDIVLITLVSLITVYIFAPRLLSKKKYVLFFACLLGLLLVESFLYWVGTSIIWSFQMPDSLFLWLGDELVSNGQSLGILGGILLAKKYHETQQNILKLEAETKSNELRALQSQVNPHFLFNNLNTLDELIDSNPNEAKNYVNRLAQLYRYLLNSKDEEVVSVHEELQFVKNYIYLLKLRYGDAYKFEISDNLESKDSYLIPPATLQLILENVVKHNSGSIHNPLITKILLSSESITIQNEKRLKPSSKNEAGTGLKNLFSRYKLLSDKRIKILDANDSFSIEVPLITLLNA